MKWRKFDDETVCDAEELVRKISTTGIEKEKDNDNNESLNEWNTGTPYIFFYMRDNLPAELNNFLQPTFEGLLGKRLRNLKKKLFMLKERLTQLKDNLELLKQELEK